jgi:hypothetical protein
MSLTAGMSAGTCVYEKVRHCRRSSEKVGRTKSFAFKNTPNKLFVCANSTAAATLVHLRSDSGSGLGGRHLARSASGTPQCDAKKTGSIASSQQTLNIRTGCSQLGCFQFRAVHTDGENDRKERRLRECEEALYMTSRIDSI